MEYKNRKVSGTVIGIIFILALSASCGIIKKVQNINPAEPSPHKSLKQDVHQGSLTDKKSDDNLLYILNFEKASKGDISARKWLTENGFEFKSDAGYQDDIKLTFKNSALNIVSKSGVFGLIIEKRKIQNASKVKITWGVNKFPKGASYKKGINNEAVMIYIYFGKHKLESGSIFIPDSPYFLGLFLGENETLNKPLKGRHFKKGGRFICIGMPGKGKTVVSEFNLNKGFRECFGKDKKVPEISAIAIEVETSDSGNAEAFIKKIEFLR
ncbi:MAG: hypothetical protein K9M56_00045 [Victivallales bacterium]|nr:hypothetical protein [Victivallales bacterium]